MSRSTPNSLGQRLCWTIGAAAGTYILLSLVGYDFLLTVVGYETSGDRARAKTFWAGLVGIGVYLILTRLASRPNR